MSNVDVEDLLARLSGGLAPPDRTAFRASAMAALANIPECGFGEGNVYRVVTSVWRGYFRAPFTRESPWANTGGSAQSKLVANGLEDYSRRRRQRA